ncbi:hypothetical protein [Leisingera sp. ANG-M1]|uniref:hypothetical protein n=1 Tax=Leisingera sp. ANG-M1 TaxID=1577895 RepID=UPI00057D624A|nr:hypothetical protein [Leisingera sp. ANG-M1]
MCAFLACLSLSSFASALEIKSQTVIKGWSVIEAKTDRDGLSCQALRCDQPDCNSREASVSLLLWGSKYRNAITPMVGLGSDLPRRFPAQLSVGGKAFAFSQNKKPGPHRLLPKRKTDDAKIIRAMLTALSRDPQANAHVTSSLGEQKISLDGLPEVLAYFEEHCWIN